MRRTVLVGICAGIALTRNAAVAQLPVLPGEPVYRQLTLDESVRFALENNPQLAALRQQHGIAAAGVVIAKTYPFNPVYTGTVRYAKGTDPGAVQNTTPNSHEITLQLQLFHQRRYRRQAAFAALNRTDWEIAAQELTFAINSIRAFDGVLYRQRKLAVTEEFLRLNQKTVEQVKQLLDQGALKAGDLILARAEVSDIQSQLGMSQTALMSARRVYYRALGIAEGNAEPKGALERRASADELEHWVGAAMELRPERFARLAAVNEAQAEVCLQRADRFGDPQVGPAFEYDEGRTSFIGATVQVPLSVFNRRQGEIQQARARLVQASLLVRQAEVEIKQDVSLAVAQIAKAQEWVESYRRDILPALRKSVDDMNQLFQQGQGGVDVLRVLDVRRKLLRAQDGYLDALFALSSASADLAQAVGDPALAMGLYPPEAPPLKSPWRNPDRAGSTRP